LRTRSLSKCDGAMPMRVCVRARIFFFQKSMEFFTQGKCEDLRAQLSLFRAAHYSALIYCRDDSSSFFLLTNIAYSSSVGSGHPFSRK